MIAVIACVYVGDVGDVGERLDGDLNIQAVDVAVHVVTVARLARRQRLVTHVCSAAVLESIDVLV